MNRWPQFVLIGSILPGAWLGMQGVHELGHVAGAWMTGGRVARVVFNLRTISRTDLAENPSPLFVAWAGPVIGAIAPLLLWRGAVAARLPDTFLLRFFAGFCLVSNGLYIAVGSFGGIGDSGEMLSHGASAWQLWSFGVITVPLGFLLWSHQGSHFGFDPAGGHVSQRAAYASLAACLMLVAISCR